MNYTKNALPARKCREACREFPVVSESIIRGLLHIRRRWPPYRKVNYQRTRNNRLPRHKSPRAGIETVIPVVSEHKVLVGRDYEFAVLRQRLHLLPPLGVNFRIRVDPRWKVVQKFAGGSGLKRNVRFLNRNVVDHNLSVLDAQVVSGNADNPLDEVGMGLGMM